MAVASSGKQGEYYDAIEVMPAGAREDYLNRRLRQAVGHAYHNAPAARETFDKAGVRPSQIRTVKDLEKLPIITWSTEHAVVLGEGAFLIILGFVRDRKLP